MITEIELRFFECFGIEPKCNDCIKKNSNDIDCYYLCETKYPAITAEKLVDLICIIAKFTRMENGLSVDLSSFAVHELKDELINKSLFLLKLIQNTDRKENFKQAVRKLFEEER